MEEWTDCDCERITFTDYLYVLYTTGRPDFITTDNFLHFTDFLISNLIGVILGDNTYTTRRYSHTEQSLPPFFLLCQILASYNFYIFTMSITSSSFNEKETK